MSSAALHLDVGLPLVDPHLPARVSDWLRGLLAADDRHAAELSVAPHPAARRLVATAVAPDMMAMFVRAAANVDPPHPPDEAAHLFLEQMAATASEQVWAFAARAPTAPATARMFLQTSLDFLARPPVSRGMFPTFWRTGRDYTLAWLRLGRLPAPASEAAVSWRALEQARRTPPFRAIDATFRAHLDAALNDPHALAAAVPRALLPDDAPDNVPPGLVHALRFQSLLYALLALEQAASPAGDPAATLATLARRFAAGGAFEQIFETSPLLRPVAQNWFALRRAAPTMILAYCPLPEDALS